MLEKRQLITAELIDSSFSITDKGNELLSLIDTQVIPGKVVIKSFDVDQYLNLFPKIKLPSGKHARINKKVITEAFNWFFKNYDYDWSIVLQATGAYVDEYESKNYLYMRNSQYFIRKQNSDKTWDSELANYCDMIINGLDNISPHFSETVV
jgi:hypothetical protein